MDRGRARPCRNSAWGRCGSTGRVLYGLFFVFAGALHFFKTGLYLRVMPPVLPWPRELVLLSGAAEIALGLLLLPRRTAPLAGWGLIALLAAVFPANVYMLMEPGIFPQIPLWALWLRLPLQGLFMFLAWRCSRPDRA